MGEAQVVTPNEVGRKTNMKSIINFPIPALNLPSMAVISLSMKPLRLLVAAIALLPGWSISALAADRSDPVFGYWLTDNKKAIIRVDSCGAQVCGTMVWVSEPTTEAGTLKLDVNNSDASKRDRPICGLALFGGLAAVQPGEWSDGWLYNPRDGETYSVQITSQSATELKVRGFLGLPIIGSSQIWTRVDGDRGGCPEPAAKS